MRLRLKSMSSVLTGALIAAAIVGQPQAQGSAETFTATAAIKTAAGASASAPVTITVTKLMTQSEADKFMAAFKTGGAAALRKALEGVPPVGSVKVGANAAAPIRLSLARPTGSGRLITLVTDTPILFVGGSVPNAKPKEGYDFGVIDLEVNAAGAGSGLMSPAAKIGLTKDAFVVTDYGSEQVKLSNVARSK